MIPLYAFIAAAAGVVSPVLTSLNYDQGQPEGGGASIVATGTDLSSATVSVGGNAATVTANDATSVTFTLPTAPTRPTLPDFDSSVSHYLDLAVARADLLGNAGWTFSAVVDLRDLAADAGIMANQTLWTEAGAYVGVEVFKGGVRAWQYNAAGTVVSSATATGVKGGLTHIQARWTGTAIEVRVDGGTWASTAHTEIAGGDTFKIGSAYSAGSAFMNGGALDMMWAASSLNDTTCDNLVAYANQQHGTDFGGISPSAFDPATLSLTAWFRAGGYDTGTGVGVWTGRASAGPSLGRDATAAALGTSPDPVTPEWIGRVSVTVTTPGGTSNALDFTYWSPAATRFTYLSRSDDYFEIAGTGTWPGLLTAGPSGGRDSTESTNPPSVSVTPVNGYAPIDFDGTDDRLLEHTNTPVPNYFSATEWTAVVLFKARTTATWIGYGGGYTYPTFLTDTTNAYYYFSYCDMGVLFGHYDGVNFQEVLGPAPTGDWQLAFAYYDGTNLNIEVNGVAATPVPAAVAYDPGGPGINIGVSYNESAFFDGEMLELGASDVDLSAVKTKIRKYVNQRYALSL